MYANFIILILSHLKPVSQCANASRCPAGMYSSFNSSQSCMICPRGWYSSGNLATGCTQCPIGRYSAYYGLSSLNSCELCPIGTYGRNVSHSQCFQCLEGTWNNASEQSNCIACGFQSYNDGLGSTSQSKCKCNAGYAPFRPNNSINCLECISGKYSFTGDQSCSSCPPGSYSLTPAATDCIVCSAGRYSAVTSSSSQSNCQLCPSGRYANGSQALSECTPCPSGTFNPQIGSQSLSSCRKCPASANVICPEGSEVPYVPAGMYRSLENSDQIYQCIPSSACQSTGFGNTLCSEGYGGSLCSQCSENYFRSGGNCVKCIISTFRWLLATVCCLMLFFVIFKLSKSQRNISNSLKLTLFWFQFLSLYPSLSSNWPPILLRVFNFASVINLDIGYFGVGCDVGQKSYYTLLTFKLLLPFLFIITMTPFNIYSRFVGRSKSEFSLINILGSALFITNFFSVQLFSSMFQMFNCVAFEGDVKVISQDPSVQCYTEDWTQMIGFVWFMIILYIVIIPALIIASWFRSKSNGTQNKMQKFMYPITRPYHDKAKWYEASRVVFKLLFVLVRDAFKLSRLSKMIFIVLILITVGWIENRHRPFSDSIANDISTM
jgi:hypothetical protein